MGTSASLSDPDVSSSEQSIDTVIYVPGSKPRHRQHSSAAYKPNAVPQEGAEVVNRPTHAASPYNVAGMLMDWSFLFQERTTVNL